LRLIYDARPAWLPDGFWCRWACTWMNASLTRRLQTGHDWQQPIH